MAKQQKLTDGQRARLTNAGVDPDRWLADELKAAPSLKNVDPSQWVENHLAQQEKAGTLSNAKVNPGQGEVVVTFDPAGNPIKFDKGAKPKSGVYTFVSVEQGSDGKTKRVPIGHGTVDADGKPVYTELSNDGATFYKVTPEKGADGTPTGKFVPADADATAAAAVSKASATTAAAPFTPLGHSPGEQANTMTPDQEQRIREKYGQEKLDQIKAANQQGQSYTSPFLTQSPGDTKILRRGETTAMPGMGPNGPIAGGQTSTLSIPSPTTIDDELKAMYLLPSDKLKELQTKLFQAGYYGSSTKFGDLTLGSADQATLKAYYDALSDVGRRNAAGQMVTVDDLLETAAAAYKDKPKPQYQPVDARDAALVADQVAQQVLGRKASAEDQRLILAALNHAGQLSFDAQQNNTSATNPPAPTAVATDVLQQQNPKESLGYGLLDQFHTFAAMLGPSVATGGNG